ncbi:MAG: hypothetical protein SFZ23_11640 [Planctomycetota bacterium]|nr:hypothetical protein [Planctomycetota bacterium]
MTLKTLKVLPRSLLSGCAFSNVPCFGLAALSAAPLLVAATAWGASPGVRSQALVRTGQATGIADVTFLAPYDPRVLSDGRLTFWSRLAGTGVTAANNDSLWLLPAEPGSPPGLIQREGGTVTGQAGVFSGLSPGAASLVNGQARVIYASAINNLASPTLPTSLGLFDIAGTALDRDEVGRVQIPALPHLDPQGQSTWVQGNWRSGVGTTMEDLGGIVADQSMTVPGAGGADLPAEARFRTFSQPEPSEASDLAFRAEAGVSATDASDWKAGIWTTLGGPLSLVALEGREVPGTSPAQTWVDFGDEVQISNGRIAFWGRFSGGAEPGLDTGIFASTPDGIVAVALAGDPIPGNSNEFFASFSRRFDLAPDGGVALLARLLESPSAANSAIFVVRGGDDGREIVREGDVLPGGTSGERLFLLQPPRLGPTGQAAFKAMLRGPDVTPATASVLLATNPVGELVQVVRSGDVVTLAPGVSKTVRSIFFDSDAQDAGWSQMDAANAVYYTLDFTDNTKALMRSLVACVADFDTSGTVDLFDYLDFAAAFAAEESSADIDQNGQVDLFDYLEFAASFGSGC